MSLPGLLASCAYNRSNKKMKILKSLKKEKSDDRTNKISHMYNITYRIAVILTEQVICKEDANREDVALPKKQPSIYNSSREKKNSPKV